MIFNRLRLFHGVRSYGGIKWKTRSLSIECFFRHGGDFLIDSVFSTLLGDKVSAIKYLFKLIAVVRRLLAYSGC